MSRSNNMIVCINGSLAPQDSPVIYANDRGLLLGDGLFETIKSVNGLLLHFECHYNRLKKSAVILDISLPYSVDELKSYCEQLLTANQLMNQTAAIRITVTRGRSGRGISLASLSSTLLITAAVYDDSHTHKVIRMMITDIRRNEYSLLTTLKTTQYLESIIARKHAQESGFDEGVMLNTKGLITESSVANLFFVKENKLITPPVSDGVFPGIMRQHILDDCVILSIPIEECSIAPADVPGITAAFQTNSLIGMQVIACFNDYHLPELTDNTIIKRLKHYDDIKSH